MPIKNRKAQASKPLTGTVLSGKISWFGGPHDSTDSGHTALGLTTATPGVAVYNEATLGGYWLVTLNRTRRIVRQTDIGPAPWTGRVMDFTYSILREFGYTEANFPTDSSVTARYLGKDKQAAIAAAGGNPVVTAGGSANPTDPSSDGSIPAGSNGGGTAQDVSLLSGADDVLSVLKDLVTGNVGDLGNKLGMVALQLTKNIGVGLFDFIVAPAWHWNQRAVAYYAQNVLDPKRVADGSSEYQYAFAWTAAFWAAGYVLLWTNADAKGLKPVPARQARLAHHVRRAQAVPARRSLIQPRDVRGKTPKKPKVHTTHIHIEQVGTMFTTRHRPVRVTRQGEGTSDARADRTGAVSSEAPIGTASHTEADGDKAKAGQHSESHSEHHRKPGASQGGGTPTESHSAPRERDRDRA